MKKKLIVGLVATLLVAIIGIAFAGYHGPCNKCPVGYCERFTYSGEMNLGGRRLCTCGHTLTSHEYIND